MSGSKSDVTVRGLSPTVLQSWPLLWQAAAVVLGTIVLTLSSRAEVPMYPVPMTLQTLAVVMIGALYGWRLGGITIAAWLIEGAAGLPVYAGGGAGIHHLFGPTGGYLFAFLAVGMLVGWLAERGWDGRRVGLAFLAMAIGHVLCLSLGAAWLSTLIGVREAFMAGVAPFLIGAVLKSAVGAIALRLISGGAPRAGQ